MTQTYNDWLTELRGRGLDQNRVVVMMRDWDEERVRLVEALKDAAAKLTAAQIIVKQELPY